MVVLDNPLTFRVGDVVRVKSLKEIVNTLDESNGKDGLYCPIDLLKTCGKQVTITNVHQETHQVETEQIWWYDFDWLIPVEKHVFSLNDFSKNSKAYKNALSNISSIEQFDEKGDLIVE